MHLPAVPALHLGLPHAAPAGAARLLRAAVPLLSGLLVEAGGAAAGRWLTAGQRAAAVAPLPTRRAR